MASRPRYLYRGVSLPPVTRRDALCRSLFASIPLNQPAALCEVSAKAVVTVDGPICHAVTDQEVMPQSPRL